MQGVSPCGMSLPAGDLTLTEKLKAPLQYEGSDSLVASGGVLWC
jgi:hypothetical protein